MSRFELNDLLRQYDGFLMTVTSLERGRFGINWGVASPQGRVLMGIVESGIKEEELAYDACAEQVRKVFHAGT